MKSFYIWIIKLTIDDQDMHQTTSMNNWVPKECLIQIVGPNKLQNSLLAHHLHKETGIKTFSDTKLNYLSHSKNLSTTKLLLWDCFNIELNNLWDKFKPGKELYLPHCHVALFNVKGDDPASQKKALQSGLRGVFYLNTSLNNIVKGVIAVIMGDIWFSREIITLCIRDYESNFHVNEKHLSKLTRREREILLRLATGDSNRIIAEDLCVSLYTVKTHVQNIYKKINVNNRLRATLWAARNIPYSM